MKWRALAEFRTSEGWLSGVLKRVYLETFCKTPPADWAAILGLSNHLYNSSDLFFVGLS